MDNIIVKDLKTVGGCILKILTPIALIGPLAMIRLILSFITIQAFDISPQIIFGWMDLNILWLLFVWQFILWAYGYFNKEAEVWMKDNYHNNGASKKDD